MLSLHWEYTKEINLLIKFENFFHHFKSMTIMLFTYFCNYFLYVTMDHKTSHKGFIDHLK